MERHIISSNNNAEWESQMMYAERHRDQILQAKKSQETISARETYNTKTPRKKRLTKAVAKLALVASLAGGAGTLYNYNEKDSTVNDSVSQINFNESSQQDLDNSPDKLENYTLIAEAGDTHYAVGLESGDAIRTNDEDYTYNYNAEFNPAHNALAQNNEDETHFFEIKEGSIYETPNGRIAVKSENLKETMNGEQTGIKFEKDSDEWSVIDVSPEELKIIQNFNADK